MKRILRFFGLVTVRDVMQALDKESQYYWEERKKLSEPKDILEENASHYFAHYSQCCKDLKMTIHLLNK